MVWAATATAVVGVAAGAKSASDARGEASKQRRAQRAQNQLAQNAFSPVQVFGPGGTGANFGGSQTPSLVAGGVNFQDLANVGMSNPTQGVSTGAGGQQGTAAGGGSVQFGPTSSTPGGAGGGFSGIGGTTNINPNSTAALDAVGKQGDIPFDTDIGGINLNLGDLDPARAGLGQLAIQNIGQAGLAGGAANDPGLQNLFQAFQQSGANVGSQQNNMLNSLLGASGQAFGGAQNDYLSQQQNPFQAGLQQSLFGGAADSFAALPGTQEQARSQTLDLLRQQAQPFEDRAFSNLQERQFATGQSGTTGGGLQTEAFARGLGQADLSRQIQAGQEGRLAQQSQMGLAQGQLGAGSNLRGMQDQLLNQAQNRFAGLANLSNSLGTSQTGLQQQQFGNFGNLLNNAFAPQQAAQQLQGGFLQNALSGLGGVAGLQSGAINQANLGLNAANVQSNARLGGVAGSTVPGQDLSSSNAFAQLAGSLGTNTIGNAVGALANRFGGGSVDPTLVNQITGAPMAGPPQPGMVAPG